MERHFVFLKWKRDFDFPPGEFPPDDGISDSGSDSDRSDDYGPDLCGPDSDDEDDGEHWSRMTMDIYTEVYLQTDEHYGDPYGEKVID